jgi:hypothetical protein
MMTKQQHEGPTTLLVCAERGRYSHESSECREVVDCNVIRATAAAHTYITKKLLIHDDQNLSQITKKLYKNASMMFSDNIMD